MDWANASPSIRQKRLEDDVKARMMDVFFSIHVEGEEHPIYVSETLKETMNPTFRLFTLENEAAYISRQDTITLKVWIKLDSKAETILHVEIELNLRYLEYVGKSLDDIRGLLPRNCIFFTLTDGLYALPSSGLGTSEPFLVESPTFQPPRDLPTSSYDALMRLSTLDACIQDALATRARVEAEIIDILEENKTSIETARSVEPSNESLSAVQLALEAEKKRLETVRKRRDALRASIVEREAFIIDSQKTQAEDVNFMNDSWPAIFQKREELLQISDDTHGQQRRVCEDLQRIYPIEPIPSRALAFTIRGLHLPNASHLDDADGSVVAAALGYVAHVAYMLSSYLSKPLPYPVTARGSNSTVLDQLSASTGESIYPLFSRGVARFRFEYGVFLLNKNIEVLSNHVGLKVMDTRHTLPNLKYLLYIATAGSGDLPARKAGGIRAFLRASKTDDSAASSRRGSDSSSIVNAVGRVFRRGQDADGSGDNHTDGPILEGKTNGSALLPGPKFGKYRSSNLRVGG